MAERVRVFALTGDGVARFTLDGDRIADVEAVLAGADARCVATDPHGSERVYVGTFDSGLYVSADAGASWRPSGDGLHDRRVLSVAVSPSHLDTGGPKGGAPCWVRERGRRGEGYVRGG